MLAVALVATAAFAGEPYQPNCWMQCFIGYNALHCPAGDTGEESCFLYNPRCDFNRDDVVDLIDFGIFSSHYFHGCDGAGVLRGDPDCPWGDPDDLQGKTFGDPDEPGWVGDPDYPLAGDPDWVEH
jgi:hypothetical protein